jgi:hypothetical protein
MLTLPVPWNPSGTAQAILRLSRAPPGPRLQWQGHPRENLHPAGLRQVARGNITSGHFQGHFLMSHIATEQGPLLQTEA